jgi:hypothetical protein
MDWSEQQDKYDREIMAYKKDKTYYNSFCLQKLKQIPNIEYTTPR